MFKTVSQSTRSISSSSRFLPKQIISDIRLDLGLTTSSFYYQVSGKKEQSSLVSLAQGRRLKSREKLTADSSAGSLSAGPVINVFAVLPFDIWPKHHPPVIYMPRGEGKKERFSIYSGWGCGAVLGVEIHYKRYSVAVYTRDPQQWLRPG